MKTRMKISRRTTLNGTKISSIIGLYLFLSVTLLTSCAPQKINPTNVTTRNIDGTSSPTINVTSSISSNSTELSPIETTKPTELQAATKEILITSMEPNPTADSSCLSLLHEKPNVISNGLIVGISPSDYSDLLLVDIIRNTVLSEKKSLNGDILQYTVSQNGDWLAIQKIIPNNRGGISTSLVIIDTTGKIVFEIPFKDNWGMLTRWLNENQVVILSKDKTEQIIFNPFTNQLSIVTNVFPGTDELIYIPIWESGTTTIYNQTASFVVYLTSGTDGDELVLRNTTTNDIVAKMSSPNPDQMPIWSPNGDSFIVAQNVNAEGTKSQYELFRIDISGEINQVTHFSNTYTMANIKNYSWSFDGQSIAFWYRTSTLPSGWYKLAIYDFGSQETQETCVESYDRIFTPQWSKDNQQLVVNIASKEDEISFLLIDFTSNAIFEIDQDLRIVTWMPKTQ